MKGERDISKEIGGLKSRKEFESYNRIHRKLKNIDNTITDLKDLPEESKSELIKYIPVSLVASMESFFRSTATKLINGNEDTLLNAKNLFKNKLDIEIYSKLHKREFDIGELLAHQMSFSKFEDISGQFSSILNNEFIKELKDYDTNTCPDIFGKYDPSVFIKNYDAIVKNVQRAFQLRHIICHEMSSNLRITEKQAKLMLTSVRLLVAQVYCYTYLLLHPESTLSEVELYRKAKSNLAESFRNLYHILKRIHQNPITSLGVPVNLEAFNTSQRQWRLYVRSYIGSLYMDIEEDDRYIYMMEDLTDLVDERITDLELEFAVTATDM